MATALFHIYSVQFSCSVVSDFLGPHGLQHARLPCPSPTPGVFSNWCPLSQWCHPTILFSVVPFSSRLQSFPASGSFQMSQLFTSGGQSIGVSASAGVLPTNILDWFPLGWTGLISLKSKGALKSLLQHHSSKASILQCSAFFIVQLSHPYMTAGKTIALTRWTFVGKVMSLLIDMLSRLVIAFLPRSKHLLILWLQSPSAVILEPPKIKSEKAMATHSSTLAWKIPWTEEPGRLQSMGSLGVGYNWATSLSLFTFMHWRRKWQPTPVFLPGESQGWGSLVGCRLWGRTESDTTEAT